MFYSGTGQRFSRNSGATSFFCFFPAFVKAIVNCHGTRGQCHLVYRWDENGVWVSTRGCLGGHLESSWF
jgi:uncharacterized protein (UPF0548 family)